MFMTSYKYKNYIISYLDANLTWTKFINPEIGTLSSKCYKDGTNLIIGPWNTRSDLYKTEPEFLADLYSLPELTES